MARLIDADAFSERYGNYYAEEGPAEGFIGTVGELIAKQPTIGDDVRFFTDCPLDNCVSVVCCKDCVYYHKAHIQRKDGTECDISEVPDEYKVFNMCTSDYGINVGGKCEYDNSNAPYEDDKTVFRQPDDYCSRGRRADNG